MLSSLSPFELSSLNWYGKCTLCIFTSSLHIPGIRGPESTPYAAGLFRLELEVSPRYPFEPPTVRFLTPVFHPNVDDRGRICLDSLKAQPQGAWTPSLNIPTLLTTLRLLLAHPNADDGLAPEPTALYQRDLRGFEQRAREHTAQYAMGEATSPGEALAACLQGEAEERDGGGGRASCEQGAVEGEGSVRRGREEKEDADSQMHVAGENEDSASSAGGGPADAGVSGSVGQLPFSLSTSPVQQQQQQQRQHQQQERQEQPGARLGEPQKCSEEDEGGEERGWDSDVSICGDGASSSSSCTFFDSEVEDIEERHVREGREWGIVQAQARGEAFLTSGEGMPPRKRARASWTS